MGVQKLNRQLVKGDQLVVQNIVISGRFAFGTVFAIKLVPNGKEIVMSEESNGKMKEVRDDRQAVVMVLCGVFLGAYITWFSIDAAFEVNQQLRFVWVGHDAAVLFMVARRTIGHSALIAGVMMMLIRLWRARNEKGAWKYIFGVVKIGFAVWTAIWLSSTLGFAAVRYIPNVNDPIELLSGWRGFQLINLGALVVSIPLFMLLAECVQRKFLANPSLCHRVGIVLLIVATAGGATVARDFVLKGLEPDHVKQEEVEEEQTSPFDNFRLSADEPGEKMG